MCVCVVERGRGRGRSVGFNGREVSVFGPGYQNKRDRKEEQCIGTGPTETYTFHLVRHAPG
jgi:hypothetical protein